MQEKKPTLQAEDYLQGIRDKNRILLAKAITILESTLPADRELAEAIVQGCLAMNRNARRIGITGAPGAGKSTFINAFGQFLLEQGHTLAVLAVDPSSTISKGSILGDKTRMEDIVNHPGCFIRPTASSNTLGGVARYTRETILLCEAFGFDYILVETVGVGQSETMVRNLVDFFMLLLLPNSGDELQGIKRGIMEMADLVIIHKSDAANLAAAKIAAAQVSMALHLFQPGEKNWTVPVLTVSSMEKTGLDSVKEKTEAYFLQAVHTGYLDHQRRQQQLNWLEDQLQQGIREWLEQQPQLSELKQKLTKEVLEGKTDAGSAARQLISQIGKFR